MQSTLCEHCWSLFRNNEIVIWRICYCAKNQRRTTGLKAILWKVNLDVINMDCAITTTLFFLTSFHPCSGFSSFTRNNNIWVDSHEPSTKMNPSTTQQKYHFPVWIRKQILFYFAKGDFRFGFRWVTLCENRPCLKESFIHCM